MESLRLKNFKCFEDTGNVDLKPITFLVGANSTGKSSFLKFFPLLKQSLKIRRQGCLLWNGDLIDFMDFNNTLRHGAETMDISFSIKNVQVSKRMRRLSKDFIDCVNLNFSICRFNEHFDMLKSFRIDLPEISITCKIENNSVELCIGSSVSSQLKEKIHLAYTTSLLPHFLFKQKDGVADESYVCVEKVNEILNKYQSVNTRISRYSVFSKVAISKTELYGRITRQVGGEILPSDFEELFTLSYYYNLNIIIDSINIHLLRLADGISYIGPLREATERFYRFQNYTVDEINPDGSNLAMFLHSLEKEVLDLLNDWIEDTFDFRIIVKADGGHVQLLIKEKGKGAENMVDVGFGYTQILPILVSIWRTLFMKTFHDSDTPNLPKVPYYIVIEQPELHLHPRFQAKFALLLAKTIVMAKRNALDIRFVIETHSEMILNKIGETIAMELLDKDDVSVVLFNAEEENLEKYVEYSHYTSDGFLEHWPIGFFAEDVN